MDAWEVVDEEEKHGIVIHNFNQAGPFRINLTVGERVGIVEKNGEWYLGHSTTNPDVFGIFPKSYVFLKNPMLDNFGLAKEGKSGFIEEVTSVLREWGQIWKQLYVECNTHFYVIKMMMCNLTLYRSKILSGMLPKYHLQEMKQTVVSLIDDGNKLLGLDMLVRDENGDTLNLNKTSTMKLYEQHVVAAKRIKQSIAGRVNNCAEEKTHYSYTLFVSIMNFVCIMEEDVETLLFLYDAQKGYPITENFVFLWRKDGLAMEADKLKVLFTDLAIQDLKKEQIYLVCYVIKIGEAENREYEYKNSSEEDRKFITDEKWHRSKMTTKCKRRPFGVAAVDVTTYLNETVEHNEEMPFLLPFLRWTQGDLECVLKNLIFLNDAAKKESMGQGLWVKLKLFHGDMKEVYRTNQHLKLETALSARKIGFPDVIYPKYLRNELYLTLVEGEFHKGSFARDRNVEVTVCVCNENGQKISEVISIGAGVECLNEYRSVIYYREKKPKWMETFKINIPYSEFKGSHLKFTFTHRSASNVAEKTFAMSYVRIMQNNGATVCDGRHSLFVYKIDHNKYKDGENKYLELPATTSDSIGSKIQVNGLSVSGKDKFIIQTYVCSTKLTQNLDLVRLLDWMNNAEILRESLTAFLRVDGNDIVKFLQDILDALFNILVNFSNYGSYDNYTFDCLLHVFDMLSDKKYKHFHSILHTYIQESFCAPLAHRKLIIILKEHFERINLSEEKFLLKLMRSLQYFIKFIVRSRQLYSELNLITYQEEFETPLKQLLHTIAELLCYGEDLSIKRQRKLLKFLYPIYPEILEVFDKELFHSACLAQCVMLTELIKKHDPNCMGSGILMAYDIIHSNLFLFPDCRNVLMPVIIEKIIVHLRSFEKVELCLNLLSDILDLIFELSLEFSVYDESEIMFTVLRTLIHVDRSLDLTGKHVALMIAVLRQMKPDHFKQCINHFPDKHTLLDFVMEMLMVFEELVSRPVYSSDWCEMILLQNSVILKTIKSISAIIRSLFLHPIEWHIWNNYFHCSIAFITQPCLQLENFSEKKRVHIIVNYKDMRKEIGYDIKNMWFALGQYKMQFIPDLVGPFLEITVIPDVELQKAILPIFFDMAQCEFFNSKHLNADTTQPKKPANHRFCKFEREIINKIDVLIEGGKGDMYLKEQFYNIWHSLFEKHTLMKEEGIRFVTKVKKQLEKLLIYRTYIKDDNKENSMICTYNLLNFYQRMGHKEIYARYVSKLIDLHLECENYTEAAFTLNQYCELFDWSDEALSPILRCDRYPQCSTNFELKESIYNDIIQYLDKGKMWSHALSFCKELSVVYECEVLDYLKLSRLLVKMSEFYDNIIHKILPEIEYFCVSYYGRGFPTFLQNKTFIHRGKKYEKLDDFCSHIKNQFPKAQIINESPDDDKLESPFQYLQIHKVFPIFNENKKLLNLPLHGQILPHLLECDVQKFYFSVPLKEENALVVENSESSLSKYNEDLPIKTWQKKQVLVSAMSFPGILKQFPVSSSESFKISPIQNVIDEIKRNNRSLYSILPYGTSSLNMNHICLKLNEIVEGSRISYANDGLKAFVADHSEYSDFFYKLKSLLVEQMALLEVFIQQLGEKAPCSLENFMKNLQRYANELPVNGDKCRSVISDEKVIEDSKEVESLTKTLSNKPKSFKRKRSFLKKMRLRTQSEEFSNLQCSNSQWYIPSPLNITSPSASTLSSLNFTSELDDDSVFFSEKSSIKPATSFSTLCFNNTPEEIPDDKQSQSYGCFDFKHEVNKEIRISKESDGEIDKVLYYNSKIFDHDDDSHKSAISYDKMHPPSLLDDGKKVGQRHGPENEIDYDTPPPLPPKERDYINIVDLDSLQSQHIGIPALPIFNKPLPPEPLEDNATHKPRLPIKPQTLFCL